MVESPSLTIRFVRCIFGVVAITFPSSPAVNDEFFAGAKSYRWNGSTWKRFPYAIIDGGLAVSEVTGTTSEFDGGDA